MALLHLMYDSLFGDAQRKMFFKVHIIHIDESAVYDWSDEERTANLNVIKAACERYGFEWTIIPIERVFELDSLNPNEEDTTTYTPTEYVNVEYEGSSELGAKLREMLAAVSPVCSNREDLIYYFKRWLILDFARTNGFKKLLLGRSSLSVTTKTMSEIAKGRGLTLPHEIAFIDDRYFHDIKMMNPIKDCLQKEIASYTAINDVKVIP